MPASALAISSSGFLRSCSQKNLASDSRARDHLLVAGDDLPCRRPWRSGSTPAGTCWRACPSADASARSTSGAASWTASGTRPAPPGTPRRSVPISTVGHSVSPAFSASSASSSTSASLCSLASARACSPISAARSAASRITLCALEALGVVRRALHLERLVAVEAMPARLVAALDVLDLERHHLAVEQADDRMQRPHPRRLARAPAHRLRPRELRRHRRHHLGHDLLRRPARLLDLDDVEVALLLVLDDGARP